MNEITPDAGSIATSLEKKRGRMCRAILSLSKWVQENKRVFST
jgi:hypothetical protein